MKRFALAIVPLIALATLATTAAQSPNAFGVPSADQPQPGAAIKAVPGSRAQGWLSQGRSEVLARHGMVATSDPLAAEAGLEILRRGGNAIDAAVATGAVLDVTSQNDTGIGGDLFALVYVAKDKKLYALNSAGWAPKRWTPEFFKTGLAVKTVPNSGVNAATVPGAISGYDALLKRFGTLGFKDVFERAARLADEGWGLAERRHADLKSATTGLRNDADSKETFLVDGQTPALYSIIRNPALAKALRLIQAQGRDAFYRGPIADAIVAKVKADGGAMTQGGPRGIRVRVDGTDFDQLPRLRRLRAAAAGPGLRRARDAEHPRGLRAQIRHQPGRARAVRSAVLALPGRGEEAGLFGSAVEERRPEVRRRTGQAAALERARRLAVRRRSIPNVASKPAIRGGTDGGTIYLTTADRWGNMVSLIHSVFSVYGSRATVPPYGFVLHNRGSAFSLDPASPNLVAPHKRPFHTIIAGFVMKGGAPLMTFGNMGGSVQPETHAQHMVNLIDLGMNVQMTTDAARFTHNQSSNVLSLENRLFDLVGAALKAKGHELRSVGGGAVGGYQGILFTLDPRMPAPVFDAAAAAEDRPVNGVYRGGSDHRKDGQAVGW